MSEPTNDKAREPYLTVRRSELDKMPRKTKEALAEMANCLTAALSRCHSNDDGDCDWKLCPQLRDNEPEKSGRHCPLDTRHDYE